MPLVDLVTHKRLKFARRAYQKVLICATSDQRILPSKQNLLCAGKEHPHCATSGDYLRLVKPKVCAL